MRLDRIKLVSELARQDMTQTQLAERSGVSRVTINYIKNGKSCTEEVGKKLAAALGVPVETLVEK